MGMTLLSDKYSFKIYFLKLDLILFYLLISFNIFNKKSTSGPSLNTYDVHGYFSFKDS